ncbi:MAG: Gfo/Idh/MocA family protein [Planctomycetaceae bacterium]
MRPASHRLGRRRFVAGAVTLPAACGLSLPAGGVFAAGDDRIRIGLVGCGGRGTGAALHAVAAHAGITITSMADAFADQVTSSAGVLAARAGAAFACPPGRRFVGLDAWRHVVESDVDVVILATPPVFRPVHAAAAVRAGRHVWCEKPGAIDVAGVRTVAAAAAEAVVRGLSFASGLALRHDPVTTGLVARIRGGAAGRPLAVSVRADLGLPWFRPARPDWSTAECALRNWISHDRLSGGHLVEHHVTALDTALRVLGDVDPVAAVPGIRPGEIRYVFADGRHIDAALRRRVGATGRIEERVRCTAGSGDLRRPMTATTGDRHPLRLAMTAFLGAIRSGRRLDEGPALCRATLAAIAGRMALEGGSAIPWTRLGTGHAPPA